MTHSTVAVIGARLNSSRLPGKHLLELAGQPLIARVVQRLRAVPNVDHVVIATTSDDFNLPLRRWADTENIDVYAYGGDVNDLMGRVDEVVKRCDPDNVLYVCGDSPLIEPSTIARLVDALQSTPGADVAVLRPLPDGREYIHEGFNLYSRSFWDRLVSQSITPAEREHVGIVYSKLGKVVPNLTVFLGDDPVFSRINHRLSVDTQRDYKFMSEIYRRWFDENKEETLVSLRWVIEQLESWPELLKINSYVRQKKITDVSPRVVILCDANQQSGLGHLIRASVMGAALQDHLSADVRMVVRGKKITHRILSGLRVTWVDDFSQTAILGEGVGVVIADVGTWDSSLREIFSTASNKILKIGVDVQPEFAKDLDIVWMPCISIPDEQIILYGSNLYFGLECFLLPKATLRSFREKKQSRRKRVLVLTGGSDPLNLSQRLPALLEDVIPRGVEIHWVRGPFAREPELGSKADRSRWMVLNAPDDLPDRFSDFDAALCVFGVSFYECLQACLPTVLFDPLKVISQDEWKMLSVMLPGCLSSNGEEAADLLKNLIDVEATKRAIPTAVELSKRLSLGPINFSNVVGDALANRVRS